MDLPKQWARQFQPISKYYDSQLSSAIEKTDDMVNQIEITTETTQTDYMLMLRWVYQSLILFYVELPASVSVKSFNIV